MMPWINLSKTQALMQTQGLLFFARQNAANDYFSGVRKRNEAGVKYQIGRS